MSEGRYSYTSLSVLRQCRKKWQFCHGSLCSAGGRAFEGAIGTGAQATGVVVHKLLEELLLALRAEGCPERAEARSVLEAFNVRARAKELAGQSTSVSPSDCVLRVHRLLNDVWWSAPHQTVPEVEVSLDHPRLPLTGIVDLVEMHPEGDLIVDFKSGRFHESHLDQVRLYALLWWRTRERMPRGVCVAPAEGRPQFDYPTARDLGLLEERLEAEIAEHSHALNDDESCAASPSVDGCRYCDIRSRCDEYWASSATEPLRWMSMEGSEAAYRDAEVRVEYSGSSRRLNCTLLPSLVPVDVVFVDAISASAGSILRLDRSSAA